MFQITAGGHGGDGTVTCGGDHLADHLAAAIAGNKQTFGLGAAILTGIKITPVIQGRKGAEGRIFRLQAHGKERAVHGNLRFLAVHTLQQQAFQRLQNYTVEDAYGINRG